MAGDASRGLQGTKARLARLRAWAAAGDPPSLSRLIQALADASPIVRREALGLLKALTRRDYGFDAAAWRHWWEKYAALQCRRCGTRLYGAKLYYRVHATVTSEPAEIEITEEDLKKDWTAEMQRLVSEIKKRDPKEVEDEVYVLLDYYLCVRCKEAYVRESRGL